MPVLEKLQSLLVWLSTSVSLWGRDDEGATLVEYGLLVALIAVALMAALTVLGTSIRTMFCSVVTTLGGSC